MSTRTKRKTKSKTVEKENRIRNETSPMKLLRVDNWIKDVSSQPSCSSEVFDENAQDGTMDLKISNVVSLSTEKGVFEGDSSASTKVNRPQIRCRPIGSLISDSETFLDNQIKFNFEENSISNPQCERDDVLSISSSIDDFQSPKGKRRKENPFLKTKEQKPVKESTPNLENLLKTPAKVQTSTKLGTPLKTPSKTPGKTPSKKGPTSATKAKFNLKGNYRKMTDFFAVADKSLSKISEKSLEKETPIKEKPPEPEKRPNTTTSTSRPNVNRDLLPQFIDTRSKNPVTKIQITRKLTKSTNLKQVSSRYFGTDQTRMKRFFQPDRRDENATGYFETFKNSLFPVMISGDFDLDNFLSLLINPQKSNGSIKYEIDKEKNCILLGSGEVIKDEGEAELFLKSIQDVLSDIEKHDETIQVSMEGEEKSEEQLDCISISSTSEVGCVKEKSSPEPQRRSKRSKRPVSYKEPNKTDKLEEEVPRKVTENEVEFENSIKQITRSNFREKEDVTAKNVTKKRKPTKEAKPTRKVVCPLYKIVRGTKFAVDAFRFGDIEGVTHYFLTHFHSDHYIGLTKSFSKPLFLSRISASLVRSFINVEREFLNVLELNEPVVIDDVEVTALDANHCPGAVMFVFRLKSGECILHVGDFRASPEMENDPVFWNYHINTIYLDTTYLSCKYELPTQYTIVDEVMDIVENYEELHIGMKYLIVVGAYVIGKEKIWSAIAERFNHKVWLEANRRKAVECYEDEFLMSKLVDNPLDAKIHVLSLNNLSYDYLKQYISQYDEIFTHVLAIRPSGWEKNSKPQRRGNIWIFGVQYSEHSSFSELRRFVRFLQPETVISTVPMGKNLNKVPKVPQSWLSKEVKPYSNQQLTITSYMKVKRPRSVDSNSTSKETEESQSDQLNLTQLSMNNLCSTRDDETDWME